MLRPILVISPWCKRAIKLTSKLLVRCWSHFWEMGNRFKISIRALKGKEMFSFSSVSWFYDDFCICSFMWRTSPGHSMLKIAEIFKSCITSLLLWRRTTALARSAQNAFWPTGCPSWLSRYNAWIQLSSDLTWSRIYQWIAIATSSSAARTLTFRDEIYISQTMEVGSQWFRLQCQSRRIILPLTFGAYIPRIRSRWHLFSERT